MITEEELNRHQEVEEQVPGDDPQDLVVLLGRFNLYCAEQPEPPDQGAMGKWARAYDKRIKQVSPELLTQEEVNQLSAKIQAGREAEDKLASYGEDTPDAEEWLTQVAEGREARNGLVTSHLRFAAWYVREILDFNKKKRVEEGREPRSGKITGKLTNLQATSLDYDELMQIASIALIKAAKKYIPGQGTFIDLASWYIESELLKSEDPEKYSIRIPHDAHKDLIKLQQYREVLETNDLEVLAQELGWPIEKVVFFSDLSYAKQRISFEQLAEHFDHKEKTSLGEETDEPVTLADRLPDIGVSRSVFEEVALDELGWRMDEVLSELPERDQQILVMRFGIESGVPMTLAEIGIIFELSYQRIGELEDKALSRIRRRTISKSQARRLKGWYEEGEEIFGVYSRSELKLEPRDEVVLGIDRANPTSGKVKNYFFGPANKRSWQEPTVVVEHDKTYSLKEFRELEEQKKY